jgi:unsaturated chondroitin disaccharide hydrolase
MTVNVLQERVRHEPLMPRSAWSADALPGIDTAQMVEGAIHRALERIDRSLTTFTDLFPAPSSEKGIYAAIGNVEWTNGFWTGMLWLAWELTGAARYRQAAHRHVESFIDRVKRRVNIDHHDLGFLYTLSTCAAYRLTGDRIARAAGIAAAEILLGRFSPVAGVIQAWGDLSDPEQRGRMIIDCNLNLPLLWWATQETGDCRYREAADQHVARAARYLVRQDASTFHTFYFDTQNGAARFGSTHQGYADDSCWARGQAWGIYGFALAYRHTQQTEYLMLAAQLANYFLNRLPTDLICCWDLVFTGDQDLRDSSGAAIAACGLIELSRDLPLLHPDRSSYELAALRIVEALDRSYLAPLAGANGLLSHGVYNLPRGIGIDESCIWGDYFYLEALMRLRHIWTPYWRS